MFMMESNFDVIRYVWFFENHYYDFVVIHFACMKSFGHKIDEGWYNYAVSGPFVFKEKTGWDDIIIFTQIIAL